MPDRNSLGPTLIAELRLAFGRPGVPSAFGVTTAARPAFFTATIVISIWKSVETSGVITVARAGGADGKRARYAAFMRSNIRPSVRKMTT